LAATVKLGFTPNEVGKTLASEIHRFAMPCTRHVESITELEGELPIRVVPHG
jgi:hypothetical protein